jgi:hypothetical protein
MSREVPPVDINERLIQATIKKPDVDVPTEELLQFSLDSKKSILEDDPECPIDLIHYVSRLSVKSKVGLIRRLMSQLEPTMVQTVVEFGLKEIADSHRHSTQSTSVEHNTRLVLKKDYSYRTRGLSEPTQYFVYLRRRKPKLDRYIGALFHVPQGCALSYFLDAEERLIFNPPNNVFELQDSKNSEIVQIVRLICLEPPPAAYTFDKQQNDVPEIQLHLEYLNPETYQPISKHTYAFPRCMYEGGKLDRYRWDVKALTISPELAASPRNSLPTSLVEPLPTVDSASPPKRDLDTPILDPAESASTQFPKELATTAESPRRVLELQPKSLTFHLSNSADTEAILKRMRLWVAWSEKAMPQSRWEIIQNSDEYILMNARFKRRILRFSSNEGSVILENSLPVLMKWFHDLSLAVSQSQSRRQYSATQLKLAHTLFIEMSLPQTEPEIVLKKLFGVELAEAPTNRS